jgi:hypothetical protein
MLQEASSQPREGERGEEDGSNFPHCFADELIGLFLEERE